MKHCYTITQEERGWVVRSLYQSTNQQPFKLDGKPRNLFTSVVQVFETEEEAQQCVEQLTRLR